MRDFDFHAFPRIPQLDLNKFPFRAEQQNFRHYILWVDLTNSTHKKSLTQMIQFLIQQDRAAQLAAYSFLQESGVASYIREAISRRPKGSYPPDFVDLSYIYSHIRSVRPKRVLEYGSGLSSLVMALALEQNGGEGRLTALEPSEEWARLMQASLPAHLCRRAEVTYSKGVPCEVDGRSTVCFADHPFDNPDMIYIDGAPKGAWFRGAENVTFLEKNLEKSATIFIDGRATAAFFFSRPSRKTHYETTGYMILMADIHTGQTLTEQFGFDQFANTKVRFHG